MNDFFHTSPFLSGECLEMQHWVLSHTEEWKIQAVRAHPSWLSSCFSGIPSISSTNGASFLPLFLRGHGCYLLLSVPPLSICSSCNFFHSGTSTVKITLFKQIWVVLLIMFQYAFPKIGFTIAVILTVW